MRYIIALCLVAFGLWASPASAACGGTAVHGGTHACYLISSGSWTVNGTWSNSAATAPGAPSASCTCTPATTDDIVLDGGFTGTTSAVGAQTYNSIDTNLAGDAGGPFTGVLTQTGTFTIGGDYFYLYSGMSITETARAMTFTSTTGTGGAPTFISPNGVMIGNLVINGAAGYFEIESALTLQNVGASNTGVTLTAGTLDFTTHNPTVNIPGMNAAGGTTLNCGSGAWTLTAYLSGQTLWTDAATVSCGSNPITYTPAGTFTNGITFATNGQTFNTLTINGPPGGAQYPINMTGSPTFTSLTLQSGGNPFSFVPATGTTITTTNLTITGTAAAPVNLFTTQGGVFLTTLTVTNAPTITYAGLHGMIFTNAATANSSFNFGGNTGVTINPPGGGGGIIGG